MFFRPPAGSPKQSILGVFSATKKTLKTVKNLSSSGPR